MAKLIFDERRITDAMKEEPVEIHEPTGEKSFGITIDRVHGLRPHIVQNIGEDVAITMGSIIRIWGVIFMDNDEARNLRDELDFALSHQR